MDFEDILKDVGGFGRYQKTVIMLIMIPIFLVVPWFFMNMIFMSNTPEHWCYVSAIANSNLTLYMQKQLIRPPQDSSCLMYDINYSQILHSGNLTVDRSWPTKYCSDGWQYDTSDYDATAVTRWNMVCNDDHYVSLVLSLSFIGNLCGAPAFGYLSDKLGRKLVFFLLVVVISLSEISSVLIPNFVAFLLLRALNGTALYTMYGTSYIIFLELVKPSIRTRVNGLAITFWTFGLCLLPLIAWLTRNWIRLSIVTSIAAAILLLYWKVLPESPRWLISEERYDEAHEIMSNISKINGRKAHEGYQLRQKIEKLGEKVKEQKAVQEKDSPLDLLKYPTLRKRFLLVTFCWLGNSIPYYGLQINVKNLAGNEFLNFFLMSFVEIPSHLFGWFFMDHFGRRWCSVFAFMFSTIACFMPVIFPEEYAMVGVIASIFAKCGTCIAFMTTYQQCPELMPTTLRGVALGLSCTIGTGAALLVPYIVYLSNFGTHIPFLIFSIIAFISGICASFLPETLNKNLPQTVSDAENFEKNFKFFSCTQNKKSESEADMGQRSWTPATLSAVDLSSSVKNAVVDESCKHGIVLMQRNSISSEINTEYSLHL